MSRPEASGHLAVRRSVLAPDGTFAPHAGGSTAVRLRRTTGDELGSRAMNGQIFLGVEGSQPAESALIWAAATPPVSTGVLPTIQWRRLP